jgi:hypothetical protein
VEKNGEHGCVGHCFAACVVRTREMHWFSLQLAGADLCLTGGSCFVTLMCMYNYV